MNFHQIQHFTKKLNFQQIQHFTKSNIPSLLYLA